MKKSQWLMTVCVLALSVGVARADSFSFTGTLANPQTVFETTLTLSATENVTLQTYGFGGGTNAAGQTISPGGTDPFLAIFAGTGPSAAILTDGLSNPYGTSLPISNFGSFAGCGVGQAGTVSWGGDAVCGDVRMTLPSLAAGLYTVVLSDGLYQALAVYDNGTLGEGFNDLTGTNAIPPASQFCNLQNNGVNCPNTAGAYALDIITSGSAVVPTPEPGTLLLLGSGLLSLVGLRKRRLVFHRS